MVIMDNTTLTHTSNSIGVIVRSLGCKMWPKSAFDFLAPFLLPRNRRFAGGYFGLKTPILCSIEFGVTALSVLGTAYCYLVHISTIYLAVSAEHAHGMWGLY